VEVRIPRADPAYPVLAHEDGRVCVVEQIAGKPRKLLDYLRGNIGVALLSGPAPRAPAN
jgi:hypothetical protein